MPRQPSPTHERRQLSPVDQRRQPSPADQRGQLSPELITSGRRQPSSLVPLRNQRVVSLQPTPASCQASPLPRQVSFDEGERYYAALIREHFPAYAQRYLAHDLGETRAATTAAATTAMIPLQRYDPRAGQGQTTGPRLLNLPDALSFMKKRWAWKRDSNSAKVRFAVATIKTCLQQGWKDFGCSGIKTSKCKFRCQATTVNFEDGSSFVELRCMHASHLALCRSELANVS